MKEAVSDTSLTREQVAPKLSSSSQRSRLLIVLSFAAVYVIWGSTYLAIRYAIETLPPFLMAATRFLVAGAILFLWASFSANNVRPSLAQWRRAFVVGALLLLCGNGGVTWAEKYIASGLAALLVATEPLLVVLFNWAIAGVRPNAKVLFGVFVGLLGVGLLVGGGFWGANGGTSMSLIATLVVLGASLGWAGGSVYSSHNQLAASTSMASGMQMLAGGSLLLLLGLITGDFHRLDFSKTSLVSLIALAYLILFGSLVAFTAYGWLLRNVAPARAATYAFVNPVVAVILGWLIAGEPITARMLIATAVIVGSVVLITTYRTEPGKEAVEKRSE